MGEQKMPNPDQDQSGQNQPGKQNPQQDRESASRPGQPGQQNPQQGRESASRQPGKQAPGQDPKERASNPSDDDAARRQAKQDPLQNRDR